MSFYNCTSLYVFPSTVVNCLSIFFRLVDFMFDNVKLLCYWVWFYWNQNLFSVMGELNSYASILFSNFRLCNLAFSASIYFNSTACLILAKCIADLIFCKIATCWALSLLALYLFSYITICSIVVVAIFTTKFF